MDHILHFLSLELLKEPDMDALFVSQYLHLSLMTNLWAILTELATVLTDCSILDGSLCGLFDVYFMQA